MMIDLLVSFPGKLKNVQIEETCGPHAGNMKLALCQREGINTDDVYIMCNGRIIGDDSVICPSRIYHVVPRMPGGKGGFGSMLRAIGAQIEKTTSREACRDLSGRRMRDVNNEKKMKDWMGKQSERAEEKERRRQERLERRKHTPNHKFSDPKYDQQKAAVAENLEDALTQGLAKAGSSNNEASATATLTSEELRKRKLPDDCPVDKKKAAEWLGIDIDNLSDFDSDSDEDSEDEANESALSTCATSVDHPLAELTPGGSPVPQSNRESESSSPSDDASENKDSSKIEANADSSGKDTPTGETQPSDSKDDKESQKMEGDLRSEDKSKHGSITALTPPMADGKETKGQEDPGLNKEGNLADDKSVDLEDFNSSKELEALGLDCLKLALAERGLKCGGTLEERAKRLYSVKGLTKEQIDPALFAKPAKGKHSKGKK